MSSEPGSDITKLNDVIAKINTVVENLSAGESESIDYTGALRQVSSVLNQYRDLIAKNKDLYNQLVELEYNLAYDSLVEGADPNTVKSMVEEEVWERLAGDGVLDASAEYNVLKALSTYNYSKARSIYEEYKPYLSDQEKTKLEALTSPEFIKLLDALKNQDVDALREAVEELDSKGLTSIVKDSLEELGIDLDNLSETLKAVSIAETLSKLARSGDYEKLYSEWMGLGEDMKALVAGLFNMTPEELESAITTVIKEKNAVEKAGKLADLYSQGKYQEALEYWESLSDEDKDLVSGLLGLTREKLRDALESAVEMEKAVAEASAVASLLAQGKYQEAYTEWSKLPDKGSVSKETVSKLLGVDPGELSQIIGLLAGLQAVSGLSNPTPEDIENTLAKYVGGDKARELVDSLVRNSEIYKIADMINNGDYEGALDKIIKAEVGQDVKKDLVYYLLASINEKKGAEALADFVSKHSEAMKQFLEPSLLSAITLYENAGQIAEQVSSEVLESFQGSLNNIVDRVKTLLEKGDTAKAKAVISENKDLLENVKLPNGKTLYDVLEDAVELQGITKEIQALASELDQVLHPNKAIFANLSSGGGRHSTTSVTRIARRLSGSNRISKAQEIAEKAEKLLSRIKSLNISEEQKNVLASSLKSILANTYGYLAMNSLANGKYTQAINYAGKAKQYDPSMSRLYDMAVLLKNLSGDPETTFQLISCILKEYGITPGPPATGGTPGTGGSRMRTIR